MTRVLVRNVLAAMVVAGCGLGMAGLAGSAALARPVAAAQPSGTAGPRGMAAPWRPGFPLRWHPWTQLWITVRQSPSAPLSRWTLTCDPDGGTLADPARACRRLDQAWHPFAPPAPGGMCPMIAFGPQAVSITGYWRGTWISVRFSRTDGCREARWDKVVWALGLTTPPGQVNPGGPMKPAPPAVRAS